VLFFHVKPTPGPSKEGNCPVELLTSAFFIWSIKYSLEPCPEQFFPEPFTLSRIPLSPVPFALCSIPLSHAPFALCSFPLSPAPFALCSFSQGLLYN
jgi:hypothetical protein